MSITGVSIKRVSLDFNISASTALNPAPWASRVYRGDELEDGQLLNLSKNM
jgi:hypothetical protein